MHLFCFGEIVDGDYFTDRLPDWWTPKSRSAPPAIPLLKQDPRTDGAVTTRTGAKRRSGFEVHFLGRNFRARE